MPKILSLYHYYYPDDVAGARHLTELCGELVAKDYEVETWPCNRSCHHYEAVYPLKSETRNGVLLKRVWRPPFRQHSIVGRIINTLWVLTVWCWRFLFLYGKRPDVLTVGTDPIFSPFIIPFFKFLHPKVKVIHWCFDLYPEYAVADRMIGKNNPITRILRRCMGYAYSKCDLLVDIGPCMRQLLEHYPAPKRVTLSPWALEEPDSPLPPDPTERKDLFGDCKLALLYSGNFGKPHEFYLTLKLARKLSGDGAVLCYSAHGSRIEELKKALNTEDKNIRFAPFAPADKLALRLSATDVHVVSLRSTYTGVAVPSKFFGALAIGRPVLFEGPEESSIAQWIKEYQVGWVLTTDNLEKVEAELGRFSENVSAKVKMFQHCHDIYQAHFSKKSVLDAWDKELRGLLAR